MAAVLAAAGNVRRIVGGGQEDDDFAAVPGDRAIDGEAADSNPGDQALRFGAGATLRIEAGANRGCE